MTFESTPKDELDDFLERAVERQLGEQRSLTQHIAALTDAVNSLVSADGVGAGGGIDPDELTERVRIATRTAIDPVVSEMRILADSVAAMQRIPYPSSGPIAPAPVVPVPVPVPVPVAPAPTPAQPSEDMVAVRASLRAVSADVQGIAQALIDLNAGLREWAMGVDRGIGGIRDTVERVRELASRAEVQRIDALGQAMAQPTLPPPTTDLATLDVAHGEIVADAPAVAALDPAEVERRMAEAVELSLYLADQVEEIDRVLRGLGDLPQKLESVVAQGVRRTLTVRAKLDTEATGALDDALASLDEYVDKMSNVVARFADSEETLRRLGIGQGELASRMDALADAFSAAGGVIPQPASRRKPPVRAGAKAKVQPNPKTTRRSTARKPKD